MSSEIIHPARANHVFYLPYPKVIMLLNSYVNEG